MSKQKNEGINKVEDFGANQKQHKPFTTQAINYDLLDEKHQKAGHELAKSQQEQASEVNKNRPNSADADTKVHSANQRRTGGSGLSTDGTEDNAKAIKGMSSGSGENS